jgi:hypothetical protein
VRTPLNQKHDGPEHNWSVDEKECQTGGGRNGDNSELIFSKSAINDHIHSDNFRSVLAAGDLARNAVLHAFKLPTHWQLWMEAQLQQVLLSPH